MTLTIPAPLSWLTDQLGAKTSCRMDFERHEEASRNGGGQIWTAQLAPPTWVADLVLSARSWQKARDLDARFRALGTNRPLVFADPTYSGPAWGQIWRLKAATVTVSSIKADRTALSLAGLPPGYRLAVGDRLSITYVSGARYYLGELSEGATAIAGAATAQLEINPPLPAGINAGAIVELARPVCLMKVPLGGYTAFEPQTGFIAGSTSLRLIQKV